MGQFSLSNEKELYAKVDNVITLTESNVLLFSQRKPTIFAGTCRRLVDMID
ncbi:hypothetical protein J2746_000473 [Methanolobus bombayensis]|nr:hypothetical protein [Methanolobus bombayensis]